MRDETVETTPECKITDEDSNAGIGASASSWNSDQHSLHSNIKHREAIAHNEKGHFAVAQKDLRGDIFDDFFQRNPAALANGWLALPHHRDVPVWSEQPQSVVDKVVKGLIRPDRPQLTGLVPAFSSAPRKGRKHSYRS